MFLAVHEEDITLDEKISATLDAIMKIYNVPKDVRDESLKKVLAMDYYIILLKISYIHIFFHNHCISHPAKVPHKEMPAQRLQGKPPSPLFDI